MSLVLLPVLCLCSNPGMAQGIPAGSGTIYPTLNASIFHDDNLFDSSTNELSTMGFSVSPGLGFEAGNNTSRFRGDWLLDAGFYDDSSDDDYLDNTVSALFEMFPSNRLRGSIRGEYKDTRDPRGTGRAEGVVVGGQTEPDEWHHFDIRGTMGYGALNSRARVEGDLGYVTKRYDNNLESTRLRDRDDTSLAGRFFYRLAPRTSGIVEGRYKNINYNVDNATSSIISPIPIPTLDSDDYRLLAGITWDATGRTTGTAKIGYITKDFDSEARQDGDGVTWEVDIAWSPRSYSTVNLFAARDYQETNGAGNFIESDSYGASWTHYWMDRLSSTIDFTLTDESFDPTTRKDDKTNFGISASYEMRRWVTFSAGYRYEKRNSNRDAFDYNANVFMFTANVAL